jgi:hypothetical protein
MIKTVEAVIDEHGQVRLQVDISLPIARRALVTILEEEAPTSIAEKALLNESPLAKVRQKRPGWQALRECRGTLRIPATNLVDDPRRSIQGERCDVGTAPTGYGGLHASPPAVSRSTQFDVVAGKHQAGTGTTGQSRG